MSPPPCNTLKDTKSTSIYYNRIVLEQTVTIATLVVTSVDKGPLGTLVQLNSLKLTVLKLMKALKC